MVPPTIRAVKKLNVIPPAPKIPRKVILDFTLMPPSDAILCCLNVRPVLAPYLKEEKMQSPRKRAKQFRGGRFLAVAGTGEKFKSRMEERSQAFCRQRTGFNPQTQPAQ